MSVDLHVRVARDRRAWVEVETATVTLGDPEAIEHAVIAAIAMRHLHDRLGELADVDVALAELLGDEAAA